jgi:peptide/nickel transport system substrate-binding protein
MDVGILGPLELRVDGQAVPLGGPKQRLLLAALLLQVNEVVSRDRLIDAVWGEHPPASVDQSLDTYVSRLRRAVGRDRVLRRPGGYLVRLDPDELDLHRFESLVQAAREASAAGDARVAARLLRQALSVWRGPALADMLYEPFASSEVRRLEEQRLVAREELTEAELALGGSAELVPELERLVRRHPLRERLLGQLMVALYRAGRHAEALAAFRAARRRLAEELGLEPGPQLRELERRILRHDPGLERSHSEVPARRRPSVLRAAVGVAVLALAVGATTSLLLVSGGTTASLVSGGASSRLFAIAARSGELGKTIELAGSPSAVASGAGSIWVADPNRATVSRVDPRSGAIVDRIPVGGEPGSIASGGGGIWVASTVGDGLERIDPVTDTVTQSVHLDTASAAAIAFGDGRLWLADSSKQMVIEIDPATGSVRRTLTIDLSPSAVAVGGSSVWVAGYDRAAVERIDATSGETLATVPVGQGPSSLDVAAGAVWVANTLDATVSKIDVRTGSVTATIPVGSGPSALTAAGGSIWVANVDSGTLSRIDPRRDQVVETLRVGGRPAAVAASNGTVWVGTGPRGAPHSGGTLTIVTTDRGRSLDPAFQDSSTLLTRLVDDTLVTFQAVAGPAGLRLVPDLALALPTPSNDGSTYAFRLRSGIRYSDGRPVRAGDFRRAIERLFRLDSPGASYFAGLIGASSCLTKRTRCTLGHGIVTDDAASEIVFHLRTPDPEFLYKLAVLGFSAPIPPGTPDRDMGSGPVPGTGPYRIASASKREVRFVRNPFFREWSRAAQPRGNADVVVWRFERSIELAVRAVEQGHADSLAALIPPAQLRELRTRLPGQLHQSPTFAVDFIPLNTHRPPFDDVRVRRALNYAIDRRKIALIYGGAAHAKPLCQSLPPGFPGYRRYCPYTLNPTPGGRWTAPNLPLARRLVAASGTRGERIDVWAATDLPYIPRQLPAYVATVLRSLGYRTNLHLIPYASFSPRTRKGMQLTVDGDWLPDYPAPSSYLPQFFGCHGGNNRRAYFCDPGLDRRMQRASALELVDPVRARALWAAIDHGLVDRAVWVPTVNVGITEFVSRRLRNFQYHPVWGFLAAQAWLDQKPGRTMPR